MITKCLVPDCPAQYRAVGCGYLAAETPCQHPDWRDEWERKREEREMDEKTILKMCEATGMEYRKSSDPDCPDCWLVWDGWPVTDMPDWVPDWANGVGPEELYAWLLKQSVVNPVIRQAMEDAGMSVGRMRAAA